jgi:hypothetical protein|tara:strand:- start:917 stop:1447 length:531 start_codon:yes stop_codon:yes gene_type:complete
MVFDRISLIEAYKVLKTVNENDGPVSKILFNKTAFYGTKTQPRFKDLADLRNFIETEYAYNWHNEDCECATGDESVWTLLAYEVTTPRSTHAIFVNNIRRLLDSAKQADLNGLSISITSAIFAKIERISFLFENYVCFAYIEDQGDYVDYCEYIELIKNKYYSELIADFYSQYKTF